MEHFGISPWTVYTARVVVAMLWLALLLGILFIGAVFVINFGLMSRREEDQHGGQEPSDVGFLQRERFKGAHAHREYLPAEEGPDEYWRPEDELTVSRRHLLHEEDMPSDIPERLRARRIAKRPSRKKTG